MILVNVWYGAPFFMIMYLAALKSVPETLYEAAAIDGANAWQKLIYVTLPMLRNIIAITVLFSLIVTFANFDIVRVLTQGGPRDMTHVFATYAFKLGIESNDIPLGACVSLFMFPILAVAAVFILRTSIGGGGKADGNRDLRSRDGGRTAQIRRPAASAPLGHVSRLRLPVPFRGLLPGAADLHADHVAQNEPGTSLPRATIPGSSTSSRSAISAPC